jgi:hypothetical protein
MYMSTLKRKTHRLPGRVTALRGRCQKAVTLATAACFMLTSVFGQAAGAAAVPVSGKAGTVSVDDPVIPSTAGRITDARCYDSKQVVIHIQDLHCHGDVQKNIAKILASLDARYALPKVYLEGAIGKVDTSWLAGHYENCGRSRTGCP